MDTHNGEKIDTSINSVGKNDRYMQKNETGPLTQIIHKYKLKME